jgi:hypothetical protein
MPAAGLTWQRHPLVSRADRSTDRKARLDRAFRRAPASFTRRAAARPDARKSKQQPSDFHGYLNRAGSQSPVWLETAYRRNLHWNHGDAIPGTGLARCGCRARRAQAGRPAQTGGRCHRPSISQPSSRNPGDVGAGAWHGPASRQPRTTAPLTSRGRPFIPGFLQPTRKCK